MDTILPDAVIEYICFLDGVYSTELKLEYAFRRSCELLLSYLNCPIDRSICIYISKKTRLDLNFRILQKIIQKAQEQLCFFNDQVTL